MSKRKEGIDVLQDLLRSLSDYKDGGHLKELGAALPAPAEGGFFLVTVE